MIVSSESNRVSPKAYPIKSGTKASYYGIAYEVGKKVTQAFGYYQDIEPYLPDKYIDKYTYKPHKRLSGQVGKTIHAKKKKFLSKKYRYFHKEPCLPSYRNHIYSNGNAHC